MFIHLHNHSHYSLLDGLPKIDDYINKALEYKMPALGLTDHGAMYGAIEFYQKCKAAGIKPIIGCEMYLAPRELHLKHPKIDDKPSHLILLAKNEQGYKNLMHLTSVAHLDGFYYKPRIDKKVLRQHAKGLIATSACAQGEIPITLKQNRFDKAVELVKEYQDIFGKENFFLELEYIGNLKEQVELNEEIIKLAKRTKAPLVASRDTHYINEEDKIAQDVLVCVQTGKVLSDEKRLNMTGADLSFLHPKLMTEYFKDIPEAVKNTEKIAAECNLNLKLGLWHFPTFELPAGITAEEHLKKLAEQGLKNKIPDCDGETKKRLEHELEIIIKKGYAPYFLIVSDIVKWAKEHEIINTTRGSASGSLVSYAIDITTLNPLDYNLPFERFLNPLRPSPPDIDVDFADNRREEVIEYTKQKYGYDRVANIATFGTMMARAAVRDVTRVLDLPYALGDKIAKMIPFGSQGFHMSIDRALQENYELKQLADNDPQVKQIIDLSKKVEGCVRHVSVHAAGIVIAPSILTDFAPLQKDTKAQQNIITQYEMYSCEAVGLLKMDLLGIRNLSILGDAVKIIEKTKNIKIDLNNIPLDDKQTFNFIGQGYTFGMFQLGGSGMTKWMRQLKPTNIKDIMAMIALFRPGPMESIPEYIGRKHNQRPVEYLDPKLKTILKDSYGVITYQDDVLLIAIEVAGYNWETVDKFRKAIGKKIPALMAQQEKDFVQGCQKHSGWSLEKSERLWQLFDPFKGYGFNKCLTGDAQVVDIQTGKIKTIQEIYNNKKKINTLSLNLDNYKLTPKKTAKIYKNGRKNVWQLKTRTGRRIKATSNHPFLKFTGWARLSDLNIGDRIGVVRKIDYKSDYKIKNFKLATLGYLLAEGNLCHPHGIYFYSSDKSELNDYIKYVEKFRNIKPTLNTQKKAISVYTTQEYQRRGNELMKWVRELGLWNKKANQKFFPDFVFKLNKKQLALLLGKMWQGDGCLHLSKDSQIFYATSSEQLAYQLQHLLLRLEIISTVHAKRFKYRDSYKYGFTINVSRFNNLDKFNKTLGRYLIGKKKEMLTKIIKNNKILNSKLPKNSARGSKDIVPIEISSLLKQEVYNSGLNIKQFVKKFRISERNFFINKNKKGYLRETIDVLADKLNSKILKHHANSDIYWDEVVEIKKVGIEETYDLTIPNSHNFVANDFIVHNSHAASYALVAYQTAYLKSHYPAEFMTAVMTAESQNTDKIVEAVQECEKLGIKVLPPDVNYSRPDFTYISDKEIRFGLLAIKNLGSDIANIIIANRKEQGPFKSLEDFLTRIQTRNLNKKSLEALVKSGALDSLGERNQMLENMERLLGFIKYKQKEKDSRQSSLFGKLTDGDSTSQLKLSEAAVADSKTKLAWEKELLGLYVSGHPFVEMSNLVAPHVTCECINLIDFEGNRVKIAGIVSKIQRTFTRKNELMMFVSLSDTSAEIEVLVFPNVLKSNSEVWQEDKHVFVTGKVSSKDDKPKVLVDKAYQINKDNFEQVMQEVEKDLQVQKQKFSNKYNNYNSIKQETKNNISKIWITLPKFFNSDIHNQLKDIFNQFKGSCPVYLTITQSGVERKIETDFKIVYNQDLKQRLEKIVGSGNITIEYN